ncbi:nucleotidyl transferase AbiEii/AbiGii toxin family protein [Candidatus Pacearchaeota archaeon]|nr:nucleotidyl transferase AbiEii/AbiGii toxin family protein [Candidatus Pacearchaeota archaeon]
MFFYSLPRFSEDLDFTLIKELNFDRIMKVIKKDLSNLGVECKIDKIETSSISLSFRVSAKGPLFTKNIETCYTRIEVSKRGHVDYIEIKELKSIYPEILGFNVAIMSKTEILSEKVRALLTRNQARDLYDLYFLLRENTKIDFGLIDKKLFYYKKKFSKKEFIKKVKEKESIWKTELNPI